MLGCYHAPTISVSNKKQWMKFASILQFSNVRIVLLLSQKREARYAELDRFVSSRGTLSLTLKELQEEGLIKRRVVVSRPIQTHYSLSKKGKKLARTLDQLQNLINQEGGTDNNLNTTC